ncbi:EAL domain-containing protein [Paenisporosarcina cavernae]|uniref:EAL domain-containing protein n=1 Tax=Paenisporosarcina cavernae TaxID=2320858 RepID=A0A385YR42_9BACL|nr:EAL domain-containing protein [Paenisporosarcina cavernae]AYC28870.1 EAL domain-containing protein [Paenisporosarcina cavernae]
MGPLEKESVGILQSLPDMVAVIDTSGTILFVNEAWERFRIENGGDASKASVGVNYLRMLEKSDAVYEANGIRSVIEGSISTFNLEYPCHSPTEQRWYLMTVTKIDEQLLMIRHENVTKVLETEKSMNSVLESMTDAFFALDDNWCFEYLNSAAYDVLEREKGTLLHKNVWEEFPEAVESLFYSNYQKTLHQRISTSFEEYYGPLDTWFQVNAYPSTGRGISVYFQNINEKKMSEDRLKMFAYYDDLTDLPNRRSIHEMVRKKLAEDRACSLLFIDLDGFKNVNDVYGHEKGDLVLQRVGQKLQQHLSSEAFIARLGGDEFLIAVNESERKALRRFANEVLDLFHQPIVLDSHFSFSVSASIGIGIYPNDGKNFDELMSATDTAMYQAKRMRGNSYAFYHPSMKTEIARRLLIEQELGDDLRDHGIYFVLQPQWDTVKDELYGFEVLSRWRHPTLGEISPLEFIGIAEDTGNILKLTQHLFAEVFARVSRWIRQDGFDKKVAINITPYLLTQKSFFDDLFDLLERFRIPSSMIELEVTEETEMVTSEITLGNIVRCRDAGVSIAIDDFGTGFSMLSYLSYFPVDRLKIDRFFIDRIGNDPKSEAILRSIIHLAESLSCEVVAEGVETEEQVQFLRENGCAIVQGYLVDRALDVDEFERRFVKNVL